MSTTGLPSDGTERVRVVGIGADGWAGLSPVSRAFIESAVTVIGGERHLAMLPSSPDQIRLPWPRPLRTGLQELLADRTDVVVLASGDPLVSGIGTTLIDLLGPEAVEIIPAVSSVSLARAQMRWSAESCTVVSLVGRDVSRLQRELAPDRRILVLSSDETTPAAVAELLTGAGFGESRLSILSDLGSSAQKRTDVRADGFSGTAPRLNIVAIEVVGPASGFGWSAGLPDAAYAHDGQLTKRDLRASALARLAPTPGEHLWDVGAGARAGGVERIRAHPPSRTPAIEADPARAARIARNASKLGVPDLVVVEGRAPEALAGVVAPDAIFIGGGSTRPGVLDACLKALRPGGRIVIHGVTLETEQLLADCFKTYGGELTRIGVESTAPVGTFTGWTPARAVTQWYGVKP